MSQTQALNLPVNLPNKLGSLGVGVTVTPDCLTSVEVDTAHDLVRDRKLKPVGLEALIDLFFELGLSNQGFLGCVQVPYGKLVSSWTGSKKQFSRTVPIWAVLSGETRLSARGTSHRGVTCMNTDQFVFWLRGNSSKQTGEGVPSLPPIPEYRELQAATQPVLRRSSTSPLPHSAAQRAAPLPSTVQEDSPPAPPSYVSQLGDIRPSHEDELTRRESEFRSTPRVDGGREFDQDEYFRRLDALNETRQTRGLPVRTAPTPSTYVR